MSGEVLIRKGSLSGRWYAITAWHREGANIVADAKYDITDEMEVVLQRDREPAERVNR